MHLTRSDQVEEPHTPSRTVEHAGQKKVSGTLPHVQVAPAGSMRQGRRRRRRRIPLVNQMSMVECGAVCLTMLLHYYGCNVTVDDVRTRSGLGRDGLTAASIVKTARSYGMRVRAITLRDEELAFVPWPAIVHWEFNHFLIVERWTPHAVDLVDPAQGRRRVSREAFDAAFTGVVITMEPGAGFEQGQKRTEVHLYTYILRYIRKSPGAFLQIMGASVVLQIFGLITPVLTKFFVDQIIPFALRDALQLVGFGLIILLLAQFLMTLLRSLLLLYLQTRVDTHMMLDFFEHVLQLPLRYFQQRSSGDIMARMYSNTVIRETMSNQMLSSFLDGSLVIVYFVILVCQSWQFSLCVLAVGVCQGLLLLLSQRRMQELMSCELSAQGKAQGYLAELLAGISTVKASGSEQRALERWSNLFLAQMNASRQRGYLAAYVDSHLSLLRQLTPLALLWIGTWQVLAGTMEIGTMLALNALSMAFLTPLSSLMNSGQSVQLIRSHLERIADVVQAEPEQPVAQMALPPRLSGAIRLENVSFQYDTLSPPVLEQINLTIEPGQRVALVGRTGSGKSTLGSILLGLHVPTSGEVFYDALPLRSLNYQAVRTQFGVVMQNASVFSGSIRENISLHVPLIQMEKIQRAAQLAALHDDIVLMPMGYETYIAEGGSALSGGQRQRLALARALAHDPAILLLDEATSALDILTERVIEQNLRTLHCTQVIIAHRLSTIRDADLILVLDKGQIVERGTHEELLQQDGYYARLIQQDGGENHN